MPRVTQPRYGQAVGRLRVSQGPCYSCVPLTSRSLGRHPSPQELTKGTAKGDQKAMTKRGIALSRVVEKLVQHRDPSQY